MRNVVPKLESDRLNGVAVSVKTQAYTQTHIYCRTNKYYFVLIDNKMTIVIAFSNMTPVSIAIHSC